MKRLTPLSCQKRNSRCTLIFLPTLLCISFFAGCGAKTSQLSQEPSIIVTTAQRASSNTQKDVTNVSIRKANDGKENWHASSEWIIGFHTIGLPAVAKGILYTVEDRFSYKNNSVNQAKGFLNAQSLIDGKKIWQAEIGALASPPIVEANVVYVSALENDKRVNTKWFYAFDATSGKLIWKTNLNKDFGFNDILQLSQGNLYVMSNQVCFDACDTTYLLSLQASTGRVRWQKAIPTNDSQAKLQIIDSLLYLSNAGLLSVYDATTGAERWHYVTSTVPVIMHGIAYVSSNTLKKDAIVALDTQNGRVLRQIVRDANPIVVAFDINTISVQTQRVTGSRTVEIKGLKSTEPTYTAFLTTFRANDGTQLWQKQIQNSYNTYLQSNGILYISNETVTDGQATKTLGNIFALNASTGSDLWHKTYHITDNIMRDGTSAPELLLQANNTLYVTNLSSSTLLAIQTKDGTLAWQVQANGIIMNVVPVA
jgi:outer membrane protein assembly factor BamB